MILANLKYKKKEWKEEYKKIKDELQTPKSIMRFNRKQDHLNDLCLLVSHNENLRKKKRKALFGTSEINNYTMLYMCWCFRTDRYEFILMSPYSHRWCFNTINE